MAETLPPKKSKRDIRQHINMLVAAVNAAIEIYPFLSAGEIIIESKNELGVETQRTLDVNQFSNVVSDLNEEIKHIPDMLKSRRRGAQNFRVPVFMTDALAAFFMTQPAQTWIDSRGRDIMAYAKDNITKYKAMTSRTFDLLLRQYFKYNNLIAQADVNRGKPAIKMATSFTAMGDPLINAISGIINKILTDAAKETTIKKKITTTNASVTSLLSKIKKFGTFKNLGTPTNKKKLALGQLDKATPQMTANQISVIDWYRWFIADPTRTIADSGYRADTPEIVQAKDIQNEAMRVAEDFKPAITKKRRPAPVLIR